VRIVHALAKKEQMPVYERQIVEKGIGLWFVARRHCQLVISSRTGRGIDRETRRSALHFVLSVTAVTQRRAKAAANARSRTMPWVNANVTAQISR
jgi:hypothetical protein